MTITLTETPMLDDAEIYWEHIKNEEKDFKGKTIWFKNTMKNQNWISGLRMGRLYKQNGESHSPQIKETEISRKSH